MDSLSAAGLATITVTYHPVPGQVARQLASLPAESLKIVVDNGSSDEEVDALVAVVAHAPNAHLFRLGQNLGLAAAVNKGVKFAQDMKRTEWILLLDQDSEPRPGAVAGLLSSAQILLDDGKRLGAVGPALRDPGSGLHHGFHQLRAWRYRRVTPAAMEKFIECIGLNGSGTLVHTDVFLTYGGLREDLFIDHVDTEWCFRMRSHGARFFGMPSSVFDHSMGESFRRIWLFGWRVWPNRSPLRLRYLSRNSIRLLRMGHVPLSWKVWAVAKLALTAILALLLGPKRQDSLSSILRGVLDGVRGMGGRIDG